MTRIRRQAVAAVAAAAFVAGAVLPADATPAPSAAAEPAAELPVTPLRDEWACLALGDLDLGTCLENPLPDLSPYQGLLQSLIAALAQLG